MIVLAASAGVGALVGVAAADRCSGWKAGHTVVQGRLHARAPGGQTVTSGAGHAPAPVAQRAGAAAAPAPADAPPSGSPCVRRGLSSPLRKPNDGSEMTKIFGAGYCK